LRLNCKNGIALVSKEKNHKVELLELNVISVVLVVSDAKLNFLLKV
jgi:hypothetical protein